MTVEVYLGKKFQYEHERRAFGEFLRDMLDRYEDDGDLYVVVVEAEANTAAMDLLIITPRALIVADFKELGHAEGCDSSVIKLKAKESGDWKYALPDGKSYPMGQPGGNNPYQQLRSFNYRLAKWLAGHSQDLPGGPWSEKQAQRKTELWSVISPGFDEETSSLDFPGRVIGRWFKVLPLTGFAYEVGLATHHELEFSPGQETNLAEQLGDRCRNLRQFLPEYVHTTPPIHFFSTPPICKYLIGRDDERSELVQFLNDPRASILYYVWVVPAA